MTSQIASRSVIVSPGTTLPRVISQPVPPPTTEPVSHLAGAGSSNPVVASIVVAAHDAIVPAVEPVSQPVAPLTHWVNTPAPPNARSTSSGCFIDEPLGRRNARFLSVGFAGVPVYAESSSTTNVSALPEHTNSG